MEGGRGRDIAFITFSAPPPNPPTPVRMYVDSVSNYYLLTEVLSEEKFYGAAM